MMTKLELSGRNVALAERNVRLAALVRDGIATIEHATEQLATTTPGLEAWVNRAKEATK